MSAHATAAPAHPSASRVTSWLGLAALLLFALGLRLAMWNGPFGSDDLTYLARSGAVAAGDWSSADYNGALRYGFNLPAGMLMVLFGYSAFAANLWPLLCSLIEVALVWLFVRHEGGARAAGLAGVLLATAPLHVAVATRIHADAVVSMFLTLAFVLLWFGLRQGRRGLLFAAGLAMGGVFWSKELAAVTWIAMLPILVLFRGRWRDLPPILAGVVLALLAHGLLMMAIAGDPLHLVRTVLAQLQRGFIGGGTGEDSPGYYLRYLLLDIRHTALLGPLALLGLLLTLRSRLAAPRKPIDGASFAALWLLGLLLVLSVLPVSLSPLRFTMKQSNYITLFLAPLAVLAGIALARAPTRWMGIGVLAATSSGLLLAALQQADYRAFVGNSKALALWIDEQAPAVRLVGSTNNAALGSRWQLPPVGGAKRRPILAWRDLAQDPAPTAVSTPAAVGDIAWHVAIDPQTLGWHAGPEALSAPLACWERVDSVEPVDLAWSNHAAAALADGVRWLAGSGAAARLATQLEQLGRPRPAEVYQAPGPYPARCPAE